MFKQLTLLCLLGSVYARIFLPIETYSDPDYKNVTKNFNSDGLLYYKAFINTTHPENYQDIFSVGFKSCTGEKRVFLKNRDQFPGVPYKKIENGVIKGIIVLNKDLLPLNYFCDNKIQISIETFIYSNLDMREMYQLEGDIKVYDSPIYSICSNFMIIFEYIHYYFTSFVHLLFNE